MIKAAMIKQLGGPPTSGQYEELFFDLADPWRGQNWHYVLFTMTDGNEWCGHFRESDGSNFLTATLGSKNMACIVSGGHGYIIDIDKRTKVKDIDREMIISLASDDHSSSFIVSTYWDIRRIDNSFSETEIALPLHADGIYFMDNKDGRLDLEIDEIGSGLNRNKNYYLDLEDWTVKTQRV